MTARRKTVLLVGALAFNHPEIIGGVRFACQSLLNSPLSQHVDWHIIDSAVPLNAGLLRRGLLAFWRVVQLVILLLRHPHIDTLLIFGNYDLTSFAEKGLLVLLGKGFRKRVVLSLRSEIRAYSYDTWYTAFRRCVLNACDRIICQSQIAAQTLIELTGCDSEKITVLMNWIDYQKYLPPPGTSGPDDPLTFIFAGHLTVNKAPDVLLRAAHTLRQQGVTLRLVICGQGPLYQQLAQEIEAFDLAAEVDLRGWVVGEAMLQALWKAHVFVLPTHSEGMPNALLEAMAAGLPVISTRVSSIPEIITEGVNGLLVEPGDVAALAGAMRKLSDSPELRREMSRNNLALIQQRHSIDHAWQVIAEIL